MNCEFKRDLNNNYMILNDETTETIDDYRVRMLISNKIPFILKCNMRKFDGTVKYYYEITSKHPLNRAFEKKKIGMSELNNIVTSFLKVLDSSIEYLLNPNDFILNPEYIYMNIETNQVYFCYMPGYEVDISKSFNELTTYMLDKIDHEDKHAVATAYELYRQTLSDNYSLREILNSIQNENEEAPIENSEELIMEERINKERINKEKINREKIDKEKINRERENKVSKDKVSKERINEKQKFENNNSKEVFDKGKHRINPIYICGGAVISVAFAFLIYYIYLNIEIIKKIKIDSDYGIKIGGIILIILVTKVYSVYKKHQASKEEEDNDIFIVTEETPPLPYEKEDFSIKENSVIVASADGNKQTETYGNTVLLAYKAPNKRLISTRETHQNFDLRAKSFLIGKMEEHVDGIIEDEMVSRIHAEIKKNINKYFLTDLNSTNGTFHNNRRLEANETVEIKEEDVIRFANVEYIFR